MTVFVIVMIALYLIDSGIWVQRAAGGYEPHKRTAGECVFNAVVSAVIAIWGFWVLLH